MKNQTIVCKLYKNYWKGITFSLNYIINEIDYFKRNYNDFWTMNIYNKSIQIKNL